MKLIKTTKMEAQDFEQQINSLYKDNRNVIKYKNDVIVLELIQYIEKRINELRIEVYRENNHEWKSDKSDITPIRLKEIYNNITEILENNKYSKYHTYKKVNEILTTKFKELSDIKTKTSKSTLPKIPRFRKEFIEVDNIIKTEYSKYRNFTNQTLSAFRDHLKKNQKHEYFKKGDKTIDSRIKKVLGNVFLK